MLRYCNFLKRQIMYDYTYFVELPMYSRLGQIVTIIGNWEKKQFVVKLFYPKICKGNNFFLLHKWLAICMDL